MKRYLLAAAAAMTLLLGGCATTIESRVTTFHAWPADIADKTYVFEAPPPRDDTLEMRSYQNLVRGELARLGFRDAKGVEQPALKVMMRFATTEVPVRLLAPAYPLLGPSYYYRSPFLYGHPAYRSRWAGRRGWGAGLHSPFYDPFWDGPPFPPVYQEVTGHVYKRELQVVIKSARDGKALFDVTVHNNSADMSTPEVMPALVKSAFLQFPGVSGVARRVELKRER